MRFKQYLYATLNPTPFMAQGYLQACFGQIHVIALSLYCSQRFLNPSPGGHPGNDNQPQGETTL